MLSVSTNQKKKFDATTEEDIRSLCTDMPLSTISEITLINQNDRLTLPLFMSL
jgi:hypothetical protein